MKHSNAVTQSDAGVKTHKRSTQPDALEVIQIDLCIVPGDEALHLGGGEHVQPLRVDDAAETSDKRPRLLLYLCVHAEMSHQVDVADPGETERKHTVLIHFPTKRSLQSFY